MRSFFETITWILLVLLASTTLVQCIHQCDSIFVNNVFRCTTERKFCLATSEVVCREPFLTGIYVQCPDGSNQWRGLCNRICYTTGFRMRRGFRCGDGQCITDFMKWCDGVVDCPNDDADEAHCNCTARPSDCRHSTVSGRTVVSSQYLFRRVFAPLGFFVIVLVVWKYYRSMKLRQRLASLHDHPDVRLCEADAVYVGGVSEVERRRHHGFFGRGGGIGGFLSQGPPPYSSTDGGPPPYRPPSGPVEPPEPPPYQELAPPSDGDGTRPGDLRVNLPPLVTSPPPVDLPPPPPYDSLAPKGDKESE